jgi:chromosome segregation ATPase
MAEMGRQMLARQNELAELKAQVVELNAGSAARLETVRLLQEKVESDQLARLELEKQVNNLTKEKDALRDELEKRIDALENQVDRLTAERDGLIKERDDLLKRVEKAEKAESELRNRVATLEKAQAEKPPDTVTETPAA